MGWYPRSDKNLLPWRRNIAPIRSHRTAIGAQDAHKDADERRFPGAVFSQQPENALTQSSAEISERVFALEALRYVIEPGCSWLWLQNRTL